jgi:hypothetical protein
MTSTPRIAFSELPPDLREQLRPRYERLGYLGEFFQIGAHQPAALGHFVAFTEALKLTVPLRMVETIALTVAALTHNDYERVQHERLALRCGMDEREVLALIAGETHAVASFSTAERACIELAGDVVAARGRGSTPAYRQLEALTSPSVAVGCLMTAARYLAHATMANTWDLAAPVDSPFGAETARV